MGKSKGYSLIGNEFTTDFENFSNFFIGNSMELATKDHCQLSKCRVVEFGIGFVYWDWLGLNCALKWNK
jgi:hypothetical protein